MSSAELANALCDVLEGAEPRARASAVLPLLRESVAATWQALKATRPDLVAELTARDPTDVEHELGRVFATLAALLESGAQPPTTADLCSSFLEGLLVFTNSVNEDEHPDDDDEIPERDPVMAVWQAAGVLHDLLEDLRGGDDFVTEPFPFPMAELIVEWPALDPRRRVLIHSVMQACVPAEAEAISPSGRKGRARPCVRRSESAPAP